MFKTTFLNSYNSYFLVCAFVYMFSVFHFLYTDGIIWQMTIEQNKSIRFTFQAVMIDTRKQSPLSKRRKTCTALDNLNFNLSSSINLLYDLGQENI